jgi:tetratricopeptide (TPR) repeat protein
MPCRNQRGKGAADTALADVHIFHFTKVKLSCHLCVTKENRKDAQMTKYLVTPLLVAASLPALAVAAPVDNYAARHIAAAKYDVAMTQLQQVVREDSLDEGALLNLALIYRQKGRVADATRLYRRVLANEDATVDTMDGRPRSSHALAREGLGKIVTFASR